MHAVADQGYARQLTDRIRTAAEDIMTLLEEAWQIRADQVLGYSSWDDYCAQEFDTSRLRLPRAERREAVASMRELGMSTRAIAAATGQSQSQVVRDLSGESNGSPAESDESPPAVTGTDGRSYPSTRSQPTPAPAWPAPPPEPDDFTCGVCDEVFSLPVWHCPRDAHHWGLNDTECRNCHEFELRLDGSVARIAWEDEEAGELQLPAPPAAFVTQNNRTPGLGENEWYTPRAYTTLARKVMGGIDLDPASSDAANSDPERGVGAVRFWTAEDDGLAQDWAGRIWLNPPYERGLVDKFCAKLTGELEAGRVTEAIVLVNNSTDSAWFQGLLRLASAVCFPLYRVRFWNPDGRASNPLQGQAVLYLGSTNRAAFADQFQVFGHAHYWDPV